MLSIAQMFSHSSSSLTTNFIEQKLLLKFIFTQDFVHISLASKMFPKIILFLGLTAGRFF